MRRAKPALIALLVGLPLLSAAGFMHMTRIVEAASAHLRAPDPKLLAHGVALDEWRHDLLLLYASLVIGAVGAGLLRNRLHSIRAPKSR
jgi:adenylate cyclase